MHLSLSHLIYKIGFELCIFSIRVGLLLKTFVDYLLDDSKCIVIAEIGINHSGVYEAAKELILDSITSGVRGVKFQYRNLERVYSKQNYEIGDSIIGEQIKLNFLSVENIMLLTEFAHQLGLLVGISFFTEEDILDFGNEVDIFDFFKIPSAELTNLNLILALIAKRKFVLVSTGAHYEFEIEQIFSQLPENGWMPLHCISNYPTLPFNSNLGYINFLKKKWKKPVGYSSHDSNWELNIGAIALGARVIERHITKDSNASGLDHSSSSTHSDLVRICQVANSSKDIFFKELLRTPNQGELINLQNLGRSYYAKRNILVNEVINLNDFDYRSPRIGIGNINFQKNLGTYIKKEIKKDMVLTDSFFHDELLLSSDAINFAKKHNISIPIRVHDYAQIRRELPVANFELHLSYLEVDDLINLDFINSEDKISLHLPDYVNSNFLIDPFSRVELQLGLSLNLLKKVEKLVVEYQDKRGKMITVVGSFSNIWENKEEFYDNHSELVKSLLNRDVNLCLQWLPPFAWYFGGSTKIYALNQEQDIAEIVKRKIPICLDTSHMLLGANYFGFDPQDLVSKLLPQIAHSHIADAIGFDGEGMQFGTSTKSNNEFIMNILKLETSKVIEVWQGHVDNGRGFKNALLKLMELHDEQ